MGVLKLNADRPDVLWLERWLLANKFAFIPWLTALIGFHVKLLLLLIGV